MWGNIAMAVGDGDPLYILEALAELPKYDAITKRNRTGLYATTEFSAETVQNQETNANRIVYSA